MLRAGECSATMASTRRTERHSAGIYGGNVVDFIPYAAGC